MRLPTTCYNRSQARQEKKHEEIASIPVWDISAIDDRARVDFYRELLVFVERRHKGTMQASANEQNVAAVSTVKE